LTDEFSLFYYKFMQHQKGKQQWLLQQGGQAFTIWCGYAFENICLKHITQIKQAMQIGSVQTTESAWSVPGKKEKDGAQIDLLIDRADHTISICEMKFSTKPFMITKSYAEELKQKMYVFQAEADHRKSLMLTFITTYGVAENEYKEKLVDSEVVMNDLFR
ncbi:MAG TPA: hypothetical protein VK622_04425, partial [Puia sp.]|nr:hypothetical protein [Puia sp.]